MLQGLSFSARYSPVSSILFYYSFYLSVRSLKREKTHGVVKVKRWQIGDDFEGHQGGEIMI